MDNDLISRAEAIKINKKYHGQMPNDINHQIWQEIKDLPPVTPKPKTDVLDKIRAEIEQTVDEEQKHDEKWAIGLRYAVKIIDKYKTEKE